MTHVVVDFPGAIKQDQYSVNTVQADPRTKRPFQVIIEMQKTVQPGELEISPWAEGKDGCD